MKPLFAAAALLGSLSLVACEDRTPAPDVPAPQPERSIEPIEEQAPATIETPAPYVDDMGGDLGTFREGNDPVTTTPDVILPEETPDADDSPPTVPPN
jgi:hypothetical protein